VWVLKLKKIPYSREECPAEPGPDYGKLNPLLRVPTMLINGVPLSESMAMIEYLERQVAQPPVFPGSALDGAKIREICEIINATIHPVQNSKVARFFIPELKDQDVKNFRKQWIRLNFGKLMPLLFQQSPFAYGDQFSAADIFVASMYRKGLALGIEPHEFPKLNTHLKFIVGLDEFGKACPFRES
jgi:glutathione S-transferase